MPAKSLSPRPFVSANLAMSADGKIAPAVLAGSTQRFTSKTDRAHMDSCRAHADAVLIGAKTLRDANPHLGIKDPAAIAARTALGHQHQPLAVVVSQSGELPSEARMFDPVGPAPGALGPPPKPWVFVPQAKVTAVQAAFGPRAQVMALPPSVGAGQGPSVACAILQALGQHGVRHLLIEGGGTILWPFVEAGVLDRLHVTLAPCLLGGAQAPTLLAGPGLSITDRARLCLRQVCRHGDELYLTYDVGAPHNHPLTQGPGPHAQQGP